MSDYAPEILARLQRTEFAIAKAFFSFCQEHGITLQAYSPIEQGLLAGKAGDDYVPSKGNVREGKTWWKPENIAAVNRMLAGWRDLTEKYHCSLANLCIK